MRTAPESTAGSCGGPFRLDPDRAIPATFQRESVERPVSGRDYIVTLAQWHAYDFLQAGFRCAGCKRQLLLCGAALWRAMQATAPPASADAGSRGSRPAFNFIDSRYRTGGSILLQSRHLVLRIFCEPDCEWG